MKIKFYLLFLIAFLEMHYVGMLASGLPYITNAILVFVVVFVTILGFCKWFFKESFVSTFRSIGFRETTMSRLFPGIIISAALILTYPILGLMLNAKISMADNWFPNLIGLFLTGGLTEEMVFRGYLFGGLRRRMSFRRAAFISMAVFSLAHLLLFAYMSWPIALMSTILAVGISIPMAYLFEKSGNAVWSPALVHMTIRTIGMVVTCEEEKFTTLASAWMIVSLIVPYIVLGFYKDFRKIWTG